MENYKKCTKCNILHPIFNFYFRKDTNKYRPDCKKCRNTLNTEQKRRKREYNKSYWQKHKDRRKKEFKEWYDKTYKTEYQLTRRRKYHYKKYNITETDYIKMWEKTEGKCYICSHKEYVKRNGKVKRLAIDHCHTTGKVRGLLCQNCNRAIGLLKDNILVLKKAIDYLEKNNDNSSS